MPKLLTEPPPKPAILRLLAPFLLALSPTGLGGQPGATQATALLAQSLAALTHGTAVTGVKVQADANYVAGSDEETGSATLEALGDLESRVVLNLSGGQRTQIQNGQQAASVGANGQQQILPIHNSLNPAAWFFPALLVQGLIQDPSYSVAYVGQETLNGASVQHLRATRTVPGKSDPATAALLLELTSFDLYLDPATFLPTELAFNTHPNYNALQDVPIGIQLSGYQSQSGIMTPMQVQKFLQHSLLIDISVTAVSINPSLPPTDFQIQ
jgi:hypothetical protein